MRLFKLATMVGLTAGALLSWQGVIQAQAPEEFYKGKTVTFVVSAAPGGLADRQSRIFAPHFQKHIPGSPQVIVVNKPGAGGMVAASELMVSDEKDGTVVVALQRNNLTNALVNNKHEQFDPRKVTWIGNFKKDVFILVGMSHSPAKAAAEVFDKTMVLGATGFTNENRTLSTMMNDYLGAKFKIVPGYEGSGAVHKALESGEVDGWMRSFEGSLVPPESEWFKEGRAQRMLVLDWQPLPDFPDIPTLAQFNKNDSVRPLVDFFLLPLSVGRPIAVPAEVPADRVAALRKAFEDTVKDPAFIKDMMDKNQETVQFMGGEEIEAFLTKIYATPDETLEKVRALLIEKK